jgi:hypothetical protein
VKSANLVCTGFLLLATAPVFAAGPAASEVVQRDVNQQQRIENGTRSGALSNREAGALERGQAHVDAREARAARNGQVSAAEQARVQRSENRQSRRIHREKHD